MPVIVNNDKLKCILTNYGLGRVAEALQNKDVNLNLSKIKVGDSNGEYYVPQEVQEELKNPIPGGEFFITEKELLEDGLTVSFRTVISETFGGCDIREVGLYETVNGIDHLFAISTQQPMVKPEITLNYFITIDYYMFLKSANLADVYDQIVLNPEDQLVTTQDLEDLMSTILFTEGNLMAQINQNSHVIGLNRATQLYERMEKDKENYGYIYTYSNYVSLLNYVTPDDIFGYWVFNYPRRTTAKASIIDINKKNYNFSSNKSINLYERTYQGLAPSLKFNNPNYFYLGSGPLMNFVDNQTGKDISSTMILVINPITRGVKRTLLARSNYATETHVFEVNELANNSLEIKIFSDKNNYITFTTAKDSVPTGAHVLILSYDSTRQDFTVLINGTTVRAEKVVTGTYTHMNITPTTLYCFSCVPNEVIYANTSSEPVSHLYNEDGSAYAGSVWSLEGGSVKYKAKASKYMDIFNKRTPKLFAYNYNDGTLDHIIYTADQTITDRTVLLNPDYSRYSGTEFKIAYGEEGYIIQYDIHATDPYPAGDINSKVLYAWVYEFPVQKVWTNNINNPSVLLTSEGDIYREGKWAITDGEIKYNSKFIGTRDSKFDVQTEPLNVASYVIDKEGNLAQLIDSEINIISVMMKELSKEQMRNMSLSMLSLIGYNPCTIPN